MTNAADKRTDWEALATDNGWAIGIDSRPEWADGEPCLYHVVLERSWPLGDWEGACRDIGLDETDAA